MSFLRNRSAQSLLETMVALGILTIAVFSVMSLISQSFFLNRIATNETIGTYLAAEGIEVTKSIIDHDVYGAGLSWGANITIGNHSVEYGSLTLLASKGVPLKLDPTSHFYQYSTGVSSPFTRLIKITKPTANEIDVQSIVTWTTGAFANETVTDADKFYNWHP
jgi:hypothetical protein